MSLEASFEKYDLTDSEISINEGAHHAIAITDIKHTVKKGINQMVALATKSKMSDNTISKLVPVINGIPGVSIEIQKFKQTRQKFVHKAIEPRYFAKCEKCGELNDSFKMSAPRNVQNATISSKRNLKTFLFICLLKSRLNKL